MKKFTRFFTAVFSAAVILSGITAVKADDGISIYVNGTYLNPPTPAVISHDRTLVPLRAISEGLGSDVAWDGETKGITITDGTSLIFLWIGKDCAFKTSAYAIEDAAMLDAPPVIMNDYTMVPLRAISELFGAEVNWDGNTRTVNITYSSTTKGSYGLAERFKTYEQIFSQKYDAYLGLANGTGNVTNAEIQLENGGVIELVLFDDIAPITVKNFKDLANSGFYNGLIFHRVIANFMIQGGGFDTAYNQKQAPTITGEFINNGYFNLLPHSRGTISMARTTQNMDSASSQFFIMHGDAPSLNGDYAAFGVVTSGMEYVDAIAGVSTGSLNGVGDDVPVDQQVIKTIVIK